MRFWLSKIVVVGVFVFSCFLNASDPSIEFFEVMDERNILMFDALKKCSIDCIVTRESKIDLKKEEQTRLVSSGGDALLCSIVTNFAKTTRERGWVLCKRDKFENNETQQQQLRQECAVAQAELEQERTKNQALIAEKAVLAGELEVAERTRLMSLGCAVGVTAAVVGAIAYLYGKQNCQSVLSK